jgi:serine/threonine protein kinase
MPGKNYSGQIIGNYLILERLGSGEFGSVYRAQNKMVAERIVAIKLINDKYVSSQEECQQFIHEARVLLRLKHQHILPVFDIGEQDGVPYIVLEFAPKGSLRNLFAPQSGQPLPVEQALTIIRQVGQALQHAHQQGIVHRDLKPDNILFNENGEALLADFGISTELPTSTVRNTESISGTPPYMAPEQFQGLVSKLSDQYSLGCITYELVTGRKPFPANDFAVWAYKHSYEMPASPRQFNPAVPAYVEQAILRAMAKDRTQRFPDIAAFVAALSTPGTVLASAPLSRAMLKSTALGQMILGSASLTIGRASDSMLVLNDPQASSHHAFIRPQGSGYVIVDLNSTNKTFVGGQAIPPQVPCLLQSGDSIRIGETLFEYIIETVAPPPVATPPTVAAPPPLPPTVAAERMQPPIVAAAPPIAPLTPVPGAYANPAVGVPTPAPFQPYTAPPVASATPVPGVYANPAMGVPTPASGAYANPAIGVSTPAPFQPYTVPPVYPVPPKKRRTGLWVTVSAVVLIAIIGGVVLHALLTPPPLPQLQANYAGTIIDSNQRSRTMTLGGITETPEGNIQGRAGFACNSLDFCGTTQFTGAVDANRTIKFTIAFKTGETVSFSGTVSSDNTSLQAGTYNGNGASGTWSGQNSPATIPELFPEYAGTMIDSAGNGRPLTLFITSEDNAGNIQGGAGFGCRDSSFCGTTGVSGSVDTGGTITFSISLVNGPGVTFTGTVSSDSSALSNGQYTQNGTSRGWSAQSASVLMPELFANYAGTMTFGGSTLTITMAITSEGATGNIQGTLKSSSSTFTLTNGAVNTSDTITFQMAVYDSNLNSNSELTFTGKIEAAGTGQSSTTKLSGSYTGSAGENGAWSVTVP